MTLFYKYMNSTQFQQAVYYALSDLAYKQIGMLAPQKHDMFMDKES